MRRTPPFSLLTFPCNAVEINSDLYDENAAMVLKSTKRVKKMFYRNPAIKWRSNNRYSSSYQPLRLPTGATKLTGYDANDCKLLVGMGPSAVIARQR